MREFKEIDQKFLNTHNNIIFNNVFTYLSEKWSLHVYNSCNHMSTTREEINDLQYYRLTWEQRVSAAVANPTPIDKPVTFTTCYIEQ